MGNSVLDMGMIAYTVTERGGKEWWTRIGTATRHDDGSITVRLEAIPVGGVVRLRPEEPSREARKHARSPAATGPTSDDESTPGLLDPSGSCAAKDG